jgi:hypothetical protein
MNPNKTKAKILDFPWFYSSETGLFNALRAKKLKKTGSRLRLCAKRLKRISPLLASHCRGAATRVVRRLGNI